MGKQVIMRVQKREMGIYDMGRKGRRGESEEKSRERKDRGGEGRVSNYEK